MRQPPRASEQPNVFVPACLPARLSARRLQLLHALLQRGSDLIPRQPCCPQPVMCVAEILSVAPHPKADRLRVCQVGAANGCCQQGQPGRFSAAA